MRRRQHISRGRRLRGLLIGWLCVIKTVAASSVATFKRGEKKEGIKWQVGLKCQ